MKKRLFTAAAAALLIGGIVAEPTNVTATGNDGGASPNASVDTSSALVQLVGAPLSTAAKTHPAQGKKIDFGSTQTKSYRAELSARRNDFKQWLRANAPKAKVTGEFDISLNAVAVQLNGTSLDTLRKSPLVTTVEYQGLYHPLADDPDLSLIHAVEAWNQSGGPAGAGAGVKVAIVDTGIDITNPCFSDAGYPAQTKIGPAALTNNKVIVAKVFANKTPSRGYTPAAIQDHGTHVAGTVACNYQTPASVDGVAIPYGISGVAPKALLGNYNVFPADVEDARSEDILNALEAAYTDGMDIANMSLGGGSHGKQDLLTHAIDDLDQANMVVAVAAGNSGPGHDTVESPGMAARALSAGASTVGHFVGAPLAVNGSTYLMASGDFPTVSSDLTAPLAVVAGDTNGLSTACSALTGDLTGTIAVISRGGCTFSAKILNAENAGADAVVVVNNVAGDPTAMGSDGTPNQPTVPAYMISLDNAAAMVAADGLSATIGATLQYLQTGNDNIMAGFSSQGPTDVDRRVKPDVVAPGVNVLSSIPSSFCDAPPCFAFFSGTSMATPHLAGSAAVVKQQHPDWSAAQIRSAVVNTATEGVLTSYKDGTSVVTDPNIVGAGLENLLNAVNASAAIDPVSTSFGAIPAGSGQSRSASVTITNLTGAPATYGFATDKSGFSVSPTSANVAPGASVTITVTATTAKGAVAGQYSANLRVTAGGTEVAHSVLFYESR